MVFKINIVLFFHSLICSFTQKHLSSTFYMPDIILDLGNAKIHVTVSTLKECLRHLIITIVWL